MSAAAGTAVPSPESLGNLLGGRGRREGERGDAAGPLLLMYTNAPMSPGSTSTSTEDATGCHRSPGRHMPWGHRQPGEGAGAAAARCICSPSQPVRDSAS